MESAGGLAVVVMGVTGTGKTTVGRRLADAVGAGFVEGDDLHPEGNVAKMASGRPLTDEDRWPWLAAVAEVVRERSADCGRVVASCSALRRAYRDRLRDDVAQLFFLHLHAPREVLAFRLGGRRGHFMPQSLLDSQLSTLEPLAADEWGAVLDVSPPVDDVARRAVELVRAADRAQAEP